MLDKLKPYTFIVVIVITIASLMSTCSTKNKVAKLETQLESLKNSNDSLIKASISKEYLENTLKANMYKSLILEEDIDKGVISISQIKKEQIENEK